MSEKTPGEVLQEVFNTATSEWMGQVKAMAKPESFGECVRKVFETAADAIAAPLLARIAELEQIKAAIDHIAKDRLGSFTACGRWTLTADLTPDEIQASYYRVAYQRGVAEERERCARIAMQAYTVYHDSDIPKAIADAIRKEPT